MRRLDRASLRAALWEYLGHPDDESPARRRILWALVALRLGLGPMFLLRGWGAVFSSDPGAFALRLGDPARWGFGADVTNQVLFLLGCTEVGAGLLLLFGAFSRVSAVTGSVLLLLSLVLGDYSPCAADPLAPCAVWSFRFHRGADLAVLGGLLPIVLCGSPFLSADRFLDKVEEEERDRAPAVLPRLATVTPLFPRLGLAAGLIWLGAQPPFRAVVLLVPAVLLALLLIAGLATRVSGPLGAGLLVFIALGSGTGWFHLGPLAVGVALALTGGGRLSLDQRRALRKADRAPEAAPLSHGWRVPPGAAGRG